MSWLVQGWQRITGFLGEVHGELRKSTLPTWGELLESTLVVVIAVIIVGLFVGVSDFVLASLVRVMVQ